MLVSYATNPENSKGRKIFELPDLYRNNFEKDRERIIHSNAFKRLEYKTQVFVNHQGDHYRNRLTHSIEAANIARIIAKRLSLSEDLAECIALAHDLGHTPFGHAGEDALNECMKDYGGFCHNNFSIKLLTKLEKKYAAFDGLNLSWEVLEGIAKHNGPILDANKTQETIFAYNSEISLDLKNYSSAEAQIASISDDIAYNSHDLEDGLRSKMFKIDDLSEIEFFSKHIAAIGSKYKHIDSGILSYEVVRIFTKTLIQDLIDNSSNNFYTHKIKSPDDIRNLGKQIISFSDKTAKLLDEVRSFLYKNFYKHHQINITSFKCKRIIKDLFDLYMENPLCMPIEWQNQALASHKPYVIADYIAGMTDRYAIKEFESFYHLTSQNI
jgi:dGTPase